MSPNLDDKYPVEQSREFYKLYNTLLSAQEKIISYSNENVTTRRRFLIVNGYNIKQKIQKYNEIVPENIQQKHGLDTKKLLDLLAGLVNG